MIRSTLFAGHATKVQSLIVGIWYLNWAVVLLIWFRISGHMALHGGPGGIYLGIGQLLGLAATVFALTQFLLMGRIFWLEKRFGLDHLASYHRLNGYYAIIAILLHPLFITLGYALNAKTGYLHQYAQLLFHYSYVLWSGLGELLFVLVVLTSIYLVRKHLQFENWFYIHLMVYAAIVLVFFHQFAVGETFLGHPLAKVYWYAVYVFVAVNVLVYRFGAPVYGYLRYGFTIDRIVTETPTTTSLYIKLRHADSFKAQAGQFILIRILDGRRWWQEHPFSLSGPIQDGQLRLTIRNSGDFTARISEIKPGTRAIITGPFGRFTKDVARTKKRLYIAGGVGITPLRPLAAEALVSQLDSQLIYGNRTTDDVVFEQELNSLSAKGLRVTNVFSAAPANYKGETGYITGELITRVSPDFAERDVYLCGPPVMMDGIITDLLGRGLPVEQLHFERFALHN